MQFMVCIPDAALNTFKPKELQEFIEVECDNMEQHIKRVTNMALKNMGKPVMKEPTMEEVENAPSTES